MDNNEQINEQFNEPINERPTYPTAAPDDDIYIIEEETSVSTPMKFFTRFISIFLAPVKLMENLAEFPKLGAASIYIILLSIASTVLSVRLVPLVTSAQSIAIAERYGVDFLNMTQTTQVIQQQTLLVLITSLITVIGTMFVGAAVSALLILLLTKIMRGNAKFSQYIALNLHVSTLTIVGGIVSAGLMLATGNYMTFTSLAPILMPKGNFTMPLFNLLTSIELFGIWGAVLTTIGIKKMNTGFSTGKAVTAGIIIYVVGLLISTAMLSSTTIIYDMTFNALQMR